MTKKAERDRKRIEKAAATLHLEHTNAILSRDGLRTLQARVVEGLSALFFSTSPIVRACDKAKLAATLSRICGWDVSHVLLTEYPDLHVVIDDSPTPIVPLGQDPYAKEETTEE